MPVNQSPTETTGNTTQLRHDAAPYPRRSPHAQRTPRHAAKAEYRMNQQFEAYAATSLHNTDLFTNPPLQINADPSTSILNVPANSYRVPGAGPSTNRRPKQSAPHVSIGMILSNGETGKDQYTCHVPTCINKIFGRLAELKRHHAGKHAAVAKRPQFWCPVTGCDRSKNGVGHAFPRKDKMVDHLSRMHGDVVGRG
jgi:hypothetical protein